MIEKIEAYISRGRTDKAIDALLEETQNMSDRILHNEALLISSRYQNYISGYTTGAVSLEEGNSELARISQSILNMLNKIASDFIEEKSISSLERENINITVGGDLVVFENDSKDFLKLVEIFAEKIGLNQGSSNRKSSYSERGLNRLLRKEEQRQKNIEKILAKSLNSISTSKQRINTSALDADWITEFFEVCQDFSNEKMQEIWAALLANEVDTPGQFSRRTLNTIKLLDSSEADLFTNLCSCIWNIEEAYFGNENMLIMDMDEEGRYSDETWGFDGSSLSKLEEIGLIHLSYFELDEKRKYQITFYGEKHNLKSKTKRKRLDVATLTKTGNEIFKVCGSKPNYNYYLSTIEYFENLGIISDKEINKSE